ncbi:hypothetical protein SAMN05446935_1338 [Burkholderia sp. YR290]|nr:hypothetical protein SAMN05446935_1338 [Burkholderia sp. YR290]
MARRAVDNSDLDRWRRLDAASLLHALCDYCKADPSFVPTLDAATSRWHVSAMGADYEFVCTGPKFFNTRSQRGGYGGIDLVMHIFRFDFRQSAAFLRAKGL